MFFIERELRWRPKNLRVAHWERTIIIQSYLQVEKKESPRKTFDTVYRCLLRYLAPHKENIFIHERVSTWSPYIPGYKGEQVSHRWGLNNTRTLRRSCLVILKLARSVSNWAVPLHHKITGISAELCEQLGGAVASRLILWAIGRCRCITTNFVINWAVPLHHDWITRQIIKIQNFESEHAWICLTKLHQIHHIQSGFKHSRHIDL